MTNAAGAESTASVTVTVTPQLAPTIHSVTPSSGPLGGGSSVSIDGTNFQTGATVRFGFANATGVSLVSPTALSAIVPPGTSPGSVDVTVTNPDGQQAVLTAGWTYLTGGPPTVTGATPNFGPVAGGCAVTISGSNFQPGAQVQFGIANAGIVSVTPTTINVSTPPVTLPGPVAISVLNPDGLNATWAGQYFYGLDPRYCP